MNEWALAGIIALSVLVGATLHSWWIKFALKQAAKNNAEVRDGLLKARKALDEAAYARAMKLHPRSAEGNLARKEYLRGVK